jgi:hypothetical protein
MGPIILLSWAWNVVFSDSVRLAHADFEECPHMFDESEFQLLALIFNFWIWRG